MNNSFQQDSLRVTQLVQDYHPIIRRRAFTSIRTSFPTFFSSQTQNNMVSMNQSQKLIQQHYGKIHQIIDLVEDHIRRRIQCYQNEVVSVVQKQIDQMRQQTHKVVEQFNSMIQEKNKQTEIWSLNNQLDYFKSEAKKLFDQNNIFKKQHQQAKQKMQQYQLELENRELIMQKLLYKYQKEKFHKEKIKTKMSQTVQEIRRQASQKTKNSRPEILQFSQQDTFDLPEVNQGCIKLISNKKFITQVSPIHKKPKQLASSKITQKNSQQNSLLEINYESEQQSSNIQFEAKSIVFSTPKIQVKDQQSQVNIYLSQHSYKDILFSKKNHKKIPTHTNQIAIQTQSRTKQFVSPQKPNENETTYSSPKKTKQINFSKNGFYVNEVMNIKSHSRNLSGNFRDYKRQNSRMMKQNSGKRYEHLVTQSNFNKSLQKQDISCQMIRSKKPLKNNQFIKTHHKMAMKFQNNKIAGKAYLRNTINNSSNK